MSEIGRRRNVKRVVEASARIANKWLQRETCENLVKTRDEPQEVQHVCARLKITLQVRVASRNRRVILSRPHTTAFMQALHRNISGWQTKTTLKSHSVENKLIGGRPSKIQVSVYSYAVHVRNMYWNELLKLINCYRIKRKSLTVTYRRTSQNWKIYTATKLWKKLQSSHPSQRKISTCHSTKLSVFSRFSQKDKISQFVFAGKAIGAEAAHQHSAEARFSSDISSSSSIKQQTKAKKHPQAHETRTKMQQNSSNDFTE